MFYIGVLIIPSIDISASEDDANSSKSSNTDIISSIKAGDISLSGMSGSMGSSSLKLDDDNMDYREIKLDNQDLKFNVSDNTGSFNGWNLSLEASNLFNTNINKSVPYFDDFIPYIDIDSDIGKSDQNYNINAIKSKKSAHSSVFLIDNSDSEVVASADKGTGAGESIVSFRNVKLNIPSNIRIGSDEDKYTANLNWTLSQNIEESDVNLNT